MHLHIGVRKILQSAASFVLDFTSYTSVSVAGLQLLPQLLAPDFQGKEITPLKLSKHRRRAPCCTFELNIDTKLALLQFALPCRYL